MSSALLTLFTDKHSQSYLEDRSLQFLLACSGFAFLKLGLQTCPTSAIPAGTRKSCRVVGLACRTPWLLCCAR